MINVLYFPTLHTTGTRPIGINQIHAGRRSLPTTGMSVEIAFHKPTCRYLYRVTASQVCGRMSTQILSKRSGARFDVLGLPTQVAVEQLRLPELGRNRVASGCL